MPASFNTYFLKIFLLVCVSFQLEAFDAFVSPSFVKDVMDQNNSVIVDVRSVTQYKKGHIENAINVSVTDFITHQGNYDKIKSQENVSAQLATLGLQQHNNLFIYAKNNDKGIQTATLFALILVQSGFNNIAIIDGGYMAWVFENELLVSNEPSTLEANKTPRQISKASILVDNKYVQKHLSKSAILDSRAPSEYFGINNSSNLERVGHIPHAKSAYYRYNFLNDGLLRDMNELYEIYAIGDGLKSSDDIIVYGVNIYDASVDWYILSKYLQYKHVKLYEGSLTDWQKNYENLPLIRYKWE